MLIWVVPETSGGIHAYARELWPRVRDEAERQGMATHEPIFCAGDGRSETLSEVLAALERARARLIHVQHEFGLFGRKIPLFYEFPRWVSRIRATCPEARLLATAHTVLGAGYRYPVTGRGLQIPLRSLANRWLLPVLRHEWIDRTWGGLDAVIVHSGTQVAPVAASGCRLVREIPHFVPRVAPTPAIASQPPTVVVFGYFSPEKGQDVALDALARACGGGGIGAFRLVLAGGLRREADRAYHDRCVAQARALGAEVTGFVADSALDEIFARATLVLAPFRETSGSGSIVQALARGKAVLASDLPLNRELVSRVPGALELFEGGNPADCARRVAELVVDPARLATAGAHALEYARANAPDKIAARHVALYREVARA